MDQDNVQTNIVSLFFALSKTVYRVQGDLERTMEDVRSLRERFETLNGMMQKFANNAMSDSDRKQLDKMRSEEEHREKRETTFIDPLKVALIASCATLLVVIISGIVVAVVLAHLGLTHGK